MLSGDNSILTKATEAKRKTGNAQDEETISLAYLAAITGNYTEGSDISTTLTSELEKTYGSGNLTITKDTTNNAYEVAITGKGTYTIDANGKVEKAGPPVSYANERIVENSDGTGTTVAAGTKTPTTDKLYIYFEASVEGGTTSISPSVPFEISQNGTYNFTITSTVNGENFTTTKTITANQYAVRAGIKIGDYITYTPSSSNTTTSVTFNGDETGYSSYSTTPKTLNRKTLFRVMDIDSEGNMELMGAMTSSDDTVYFSGAQGYNNAVSVLNNKCSDLYKDESKGITARSIKEEDITKRFNSTGTGKMTAYIDERVGNVETPTSNTLTQGTYIDSVSSTNKTVTYKNSSSYYPNIFQYEVGGLIGTTATTGALARSAKPLASLYGADEILTSADTEGEPATAIPQSSKVTGTGTLTVPFTYSNTTHDANDFTDTTNKTAYNSMFFGTGTYYWLASRCIYCNSSNAYFYLRYVNTSRLSAYVLYGSSDSTYSYGNRVCPVVSIPSSVKVEVKDGTSGKGAHVVK